MRSSLSFRSLGLVVVLGLATSACSPTTGSPSVPPAGGPSASGSPETSAFAPSAPATSAAPIATEIPAGTQAGCTSLPMTGRLASDRLAGAAVESLAGGDRVTFTFLPASDPVSPGGPPSAELKLAVPPFTFAGSGLPFEVAGAHHVSLVMRSMTITDEAGVPTYSGQRQLKPSGPIVRGLTLFDESEGVVGWIVGFDGGGCVMVSRATDPERLILEFPVR